MPLADNVRRCGIAIGKIPLYIPKKIVRWLGMGSACEFHDSMFELKESGRETMSRKQTDKQFLKMALRGAGSNPLKKAVAYTAYGIVRATGWIWWDLV